MIATGRWICSVVVAGLLIGMLGGCKEKAEAQPPAKAETAAARVEAPAEKAPAEAKLSEEEVKQARRTTSSNMKQIGLALLMYSGDAKGAFPTGEYYEGLNALIQSKLLRMGKVWTRPYTPASKVTDAERLGPESCSYLYLGSGLKDDDAGYATTMLLIEKPGLDPDGCTALFVDGHVEFIEGQFSSALEVIDGHARQHSMSAAPEGNRTRAQAADSRRRELGY